ncbi:flagellar hook assembly protein FlgD [Desulfovibrio oxamicus]|uniref:Basal-body rod modification protein FlgD n=1 Tax=Nitratidesulfovibrio oxamicus TaxID=32016 RepID=A0ABS0J969_9BACT|nr:flagellar hook capping FlgD N-terminal domain-containing protein [Nitratidesulfovibrio oxamicus]MBG3879008.1 flagellar hook assembly protein FlgD [Nitratidesulfovibrio oxamicus]
MAASPVLGQAEQTFNNYLGAKTKNDELDKQAFLNLLVAQLSHQDPLNPMDDKEFVAQLAQFTSLEQLTNISTGITDLNASAKQQQMSAAVGYIGKEVTASGYEISKTSQKDSTGATVNSVSTVYFTTQEQVSNGYINIYDSQMNLVRTELMGAKQPGTYQYKWDGKDYQGTMVPDGVYAVAMYGEGTDGKSVYITTQVSGQVSGVVKVDGEPYLSLADGRHIAFSNVSEIVAPNTNTDGNDPDDDDSGDDTGDDSGSGTEGDS